MQARNPYDAPKAQVADQRSTAYGEIRIFTSKGRIGRLRYIAYTTGLPMLIMMLIGVFGALLGRILGPDTGPALMFPVMAVGYVVMFVMMVLLTIQRAHDFNSSGWMALVVLIPLVNLIFWFIPGTDGDNEYGLRPPPNNIGVVILSLVPPIVFVVGMIAAIALPAYEEYVNRTRAEQQQFR
jgi:uncharacterized membrane protein YhaH (DUF805 family)